MLIYVALLFAGIMAAILALALVPEMWREAVFWGSAASLASATVLLLVSLSLAGKAPPPKLKTHRLP